jgi:riboflavin kinase, archaea type
MEIKGEVVSGLDKAGSFIVKYNELFEKSLGFIPYPGTLNIKTAEIISFPSDKKIEIAPGNGLGKVDCFKAKINKDLRCAVVVPHKTIHDKTIVEIISEFNLREKLQLKDGDEITCELV